jgi:hypothetical protein
MEKHGVGRGGGAAPCASSFPRRRQCFLLAWSAHSVLCVSRLPFPSLSLISLPPFLQISALLCAATFSRLQ